MSTRKPIVAGQFYPNDETACRAALAACLLGDTARTDLPGKLHGGIVPHAGWMCSGAVAGRVFRALAEAGQPECIVMFGAVHRWPGRRAAIDRARSWETPMGCVPPASDIADELLARCKHTTDAPDAFDGEHSLEVQMPFVKYLFPNARVIPIMVPPTEDAVAVGQAVGTLLAERGRSDMVIGTTDLTHYGPSYGFIPQGTGDAGLAWARDVNDRRIIDRIISLQADEVVRETRDHRNACGGGAIAATIAAACGLGATRGHLLEHTTSREVLGRPSLDAVGYAGVVIGD